jgi:hypothetical protein
MSYCDDTKCFQVLPCETHSKAQEDLPGGALNAWIMERFNQGSDSPELPPQKIDLSACLSSDFDCSQIQRQDLQGGLAGFGVVLEGVLTRAECMRLIEASEKVGYGTLGDSATGAAYRGNRRLQLDETSGKLGEEVWRRIKPYVPLTQEIPGDGKYEFESLNTRYRCAKYFKGEAFMVHVDKPTVYEPTRQSVLTVNIYLNDLVPEQGGRTRFYQKINGKPVAAAGGSAGSLVLFQQANMSYTPFHDGEMVKEGLKYLMRTDVIYKQCAA